MLLAEWEGCGQYSHAPNCLVFTISKAVPRMQGLSCASPVMLDICGPHLGGEPAEGNKTGGPIGSGDTSLISPVAWPPQCSRGTHLLACKIHEMRKVRYGLE